MAKFGILESYFLKIKVEGEGISESNQMDLKLNPFLIHTLLEHGSVLI